jgi:hypothetical protein
MRQPYRQAIIILLLLLSASLACAVPGINSEPTPPPQPTPEGDTIYYTAPYEVVLEPGVTIPGTRVTYVQMVGDVHEISIDGLRAYRQVGDSITWRGVIAPGLFGDYRLRLSSDFRGRLLAEGEVALAVFNPDPIEVPPTQSPNGSLHFQGIPITYHVPEGYRVPGTTLVYQGIRNDLAELSGTASYPYFALDDSLLWLGMLRENVFVRYNVRVAGLNESGLTLSGTAEVWASE